MNLIVAVDKNWAIGNKNKLLVSIPNDMKNFRKITTGNVIVMGRKTLESFPQGQPLGNRVNIVLTGNQKYHVNGATLVHSFEELMDELKQYEDEQIYIIGGESIYRQMLPYCDKAIVTKIDEAYEADTYFPNLDEMEEWEIAEESEEQTYFDICYTFVTYKRKKA
jgi:dihydrofolate reductase